MAGLQEYLDQYLPPVQPTAPTPTATPADAAALAQARNDPMAGLMTNVAMERGNELATGNQIINDFQNIPLNEFTRKYGTETAIQMGQLAEGRNTMLDLEGGNRTAGERLGDAGSGVVTGLVGGIGDAATLAAGVVNNDAGRFTANLTTGFRDWMNENTQSLDNQRNKVLGGIRAQLDSADNLAQYERDGDSFQSSLAYLGRGLVNGAARFWEDPQSLETGLPEGVGSLLAGGPLAKGIGVVGKLAGLGKMATTSAVPLAIGAMEGGSAYSGAMQEVMGMSHEELLANSPTYREQIASGVNPEEAKENVASRAAQIAGAIQAPIGMVTGKLVARFEANPLGSRGFKEMVGNIVRETAEEGLQSAFGQMAQNVGVQQADENLSILNDVGDQTAQGAILGSLTAGVVQAPRVPGMAMREAGAALRARGEQLQAANEAASGVTDADLEQAGVTASENLAPVAEAVETVAQSMPEDLRQEIDPGKLRERVEQTTTVRDEEVMNLGRNTIKYMMDNQIEPPANRTNMIMSMARVAMTEDAPADVRTSAGLFLLREMDSNRKLFDEDLTEAMGSMDQASPEYEALSGYRNLLAQLESSEKVKDALTWIATNGRDNLTGNGEVNEQTVSNAVNATTSAPSSLGSKGAANFLKQADDGNITVTPEQRRALRNTQITNELADQADFKVTTTDSLVGDPDPETSSVKDVAAQVMQRGNEGNGALSLDQHVGRINTAVLAGDVAAGQAALRALGNFALNQRRKVNALVESLRTGEPAMYTPFGPHGKQITPRPLKFHKGNAGSAALARRLTIEANLLSDQFNALADANPDFAITRRLDPVAENAAFFGNEDVRTQEQAQQSEPRVEGEQTAPETETVADEAPIARVDVDTRTEFEKRFPRLYKNAEGVSRFTQAFTGKKIGEYLKQDKPLVALGTKVMSGENDFGYQPEQVSALRDYLMAGYRLISGEGGIVDEEKGLAGSLVERAIAFGRAEVTNKGEKVQRAKLIKDREDIAGWMNGHAISIMDQSGAGGIAYNAPLMQTAILAALDWYAGSHNRQSRLDKEALAETLDVDMSEIPNDMVEKFNSGVPLTQAVRGLAENISQFWDLSPNRDAPENLVKGIPEAVAKELLGAMESAGWFTSENLTLPGKSIPYRQFYFGENMDPGLRGILADMGPARKLLRTEGKVGIDPNNISFEPIKATAPSQMRNAAVKNTATQQKVLKKAQSIAHFFYQNSYDMLQAIGAEGMIEFAGSTIIGPKTKLNKAHKASLEGRNRTITQAMEAITAQKGEMDAQAALTGKNIEEIARYYAFNYSRVNRLQMLGVNNPQSDKIARHVFLPTKRTLDMTDPASDAAMGFWMSIAQGLGDGRGWKPQHYTREQNVAEGQRLVEEDFAPVMDELRDWLKAGRTGSLRAWSQKVRQIEPGTTEHGLMSLLSAAEFLNAQEAGTLSEFTTHSYFEADGVTNGPANALMNFTTRITEGWIKTARKAGAFIGMKNTSMVSQKGQNDLYQEAADKLAAEQLAFAKTLPADVADVHRSLFRVMQALGMKIAFENGELKIKRKVLKNPLTITIYGSGVSGIAGNVTNEILGLLYEAMSDHLGSTTNAQFGDGMMVNGKEYTAAEFWGDLANLTNKTVSRTKEGEFVTAPAKFVRNLSVPTNAALQQFEFSKAEFANIRDNVRHLFVQNMSEAIDATVMDHVKGMVDAVQKSTAAQSIVMKYMFRKELLKAMAERQKRPGFRQGDFLSQKELTAIFDRLMPYAARIDTDHQSFLLGSGERSNLMKTTKVMVDGQEISVNKVEAFSRSLTNALKTPAYAYMPDAAGVSGVPNVNIGTGDGRMIDAFLEGLEGFGVLPVFDGINLPVDKVFEGSALANASVMKSWTENPAKHISAGYKAWLGRLPLEQLFDPNDPWNTEIADLQRDLSSAVTGLRSIEPMALDAIQSRLEEFDATLTEGQQAIEDRITAMKALPMSVDQMAGGMTPYTQEGTIALSETASDAEIAIALDKAVKKAQTTRTKGEAVEGRNRDFIHAFQKLAGTDPDTGALVANLSALNGIRQTLNNKLSNIQREMLSAAMASLGDSNVKVVFGTPETVRRFEEVHYPDTFEANEASFMGKIDVNNDVIYLTNPSAETLAHELLHAATIHKMKGFYADRNSVTVADGEAITRMEGLMNEWLAQSYERQGPVVGAAHRMAISAIMGHLNNGRKAEALNEFLAWSLSNQNIITLQKKMRVENPVYRIMGQALTALKQLIWGHKKAPQVGTDMFSNVRFNAKVLMATPTPVELFMRDFDAVAMYQSNTFGKDGRLADLRQRFGKSIYTYVQTGFETNRIAKKGEYELRRREALNALIRHGEIANRVAVPFKMDMQQISTFKMIGSSLAMAEHLNNASLSRMYDVHSAVIDQIKVEDFQYNDGRDEQADRYQAQQKYDVLMGISVTGRNAKGQSTQLANFVALAAVDPQFRSILRDMKFPAKIMDKSWKADALFERAAMAVTNGLAVYASGQGRDNLDLLSAMDALSINLTEQVGDQRSFVENHVDNALDGADKIARTFIENTSKKALNWAETLQNPLGKKGAKVIANFTKLFTEEGTKSLQRATMGFINQPEVLDAQREWISEVIGRTDQNAPVFDLITKTRTLVDQVRQMWREKFPKTLRAGFSRKLTEQEWADLHVGIGKTDAASLFGVFGQERTIELLSSGSARRDEIAKLSAGLPPMVRTKGEQLATYMVTGEYGNQLQANAYAIAKLNKAEGQVQQIDALVTLLAMEKMPESSQNSLKNLLENERDGFLGVYHTTLATRADELSKNTTERAKLNHFKGHLRAPAQEGVHLTIAPKTDHGMWTSRGYVLLGDYNGSSADVGREGMAYYFAPVSGRAKFNRGIMQNVQQSIFGVNPETGYSTGSLTAGRITDPRAVASITKRISGEAKTNENLRPIYGDNGQIVAYERMADPMRLSNLNEKQDMAVALGTWRGRQHEEQMSRMVNENLVDRVKDDWEAGKLNNETNQFVDMSKSNSPIVQDAWAVIPRETKAYIEQTFGKAGFPVRRDQLLDVAGSRSATVGDFWTGNSRWSETTQKEIRTLLMGFMGNKAYTNLVRAESLWQDLVTDAKVMIVVKSMIVPAANYIAGVYQLSMNGVPIRHIFDGYKKKTVELNRYIQTREKEQELQIELERAIGGQDIAKQKVLRSRLQAIEDSYKALSFYPLLHEFGAVTEGGISAEDLAISKGGYAALIDKAANAMPEGLRDAARYGFVTRDTSLFKAMSRAVQYGDFLAKAVLYDDLVKRKNIPSNEAVAFVSEEFVNYNRFAGRSRSYMESMGLLWFWNFKLRSMKIGQRMMQRSPVRALLHTALTPRIPMIGSVGNPISDNFLSVMMDGRLGGSVGPGMLFRAPQLNPWWNLTN